MTNFIVDAGFIGWLSLTASVKPTADNGATAMPTADNGTLAAFRPAATASGTTNVFVGCAFTTLDVKNANKPAATTNALTALNRFISLTYRINSRPRV